VFNSKKPQAQRPLRAAAQMTDKAVTILTSGCHFNGKLYCRGSSRIGGKIEGQIVSEGLLIIEEEAVVLGEIRAEEAIIQGQVVGKLEAYGRVELASSCKFDGDITSPSMCVHEGAQFNGRSSMVNATELQDKFKHKLESITGSADDSHMPNAAPSSDAIAMRLPEVNVNS
jgi:cytoskeletal protein CcmA (bactofilin family)